MSEYEVARTILATDSTWRLAVDADSRAPLLVAERQASDSAYHPYFCRGTTKGRPVNFSFALVRGDTFRVIFVTTDSGIAPAVDEAARATWLDEGAVMCRDDGVDIAPFNGDEFVSFRWNSRLRRLELVADDAAHPDDET